MWLVPPCKNDEQATPKEAVDLSLEEGFYS